MNLLPTHPDYKPLPKELTAREKSIKDWRENRNKLLYSPLDSDLLSEEQRTRLEFEMGCHNHIKRKLPV